MAKQLFQQEMEIVHAIRQIAGEHHIKTVADDVHVINSAAVTSAILTTPLIEGLGFNVKTKENILNLNYSSQRRDDKQRPVTGFDAPVRLRVTVHTDEPTREQVEQQTEPHMPYYVQTAYLGTDYYSNAEGKYAKVVHIPAYVVDSRPSLANDKYGTDDVIRIGRVASEMTVGDFELAGNALTILRERLQTPQQ